MELKVTATSSLRRRIVTALLVTCLSVAVILASFGVYIVVAASRSIGDNPGSGVFVLLCGGGAMLSFAGAMSAWWLRAICDRVSATAHWTSLSLITGLAALPTFVLAALLCAMLISDALR